MSKELIELSDTLADVTARVAGSVVAIHTERRGSSSGIVWRPGIVVTSEHALRRDEEIQLTLPDGRVAAASMAGRDPSTDIAVVKCADLGKIDAAFGDASALKPGNITLVVGRTRASGPVAALGVVSLVAPERHNWTGTSIAPYVRLDVALQPTAIGGAVVDAHGSVVGMATPRFARFGAIAVPAATINKIVDTLLQKGHIPRGYLGVGLQSVRLPEAMREKVKWSEKTAVIVMDVHPNGSADKAGIAIGDLLVSLANLPITHLEDIQARLNSDSIGKTLPIKFIRDGAIRETSIVVAERDYGGK